MERTVSNSVKSVMFCISTPSIKTRVHFVPTAGGSTSHHAVTCVLTLFGKGIEKKSVMLDGGRLNQPDGVRLEDAFPTLRGEASGIFGLEVNLSCPQGRVSLLTSQAAIEFVSQNSSLLYVSAPFTPESDDQTTVQGELNARLVAARRKSFVGIGVQDSFLSTSLVMINATDETIRPSLFHGVGEESPSLPVGNLSPQSAVEIPLEESLFKNAVPHECLWGLSRAEAISIAPDALTPQTAYYLMYRDPVSKRPLSVCAL